jgi:DNA primase
MRTSDDWIERVRAASDIVEIIGQTVSLKRVGRNWVGLCPFHQEKTPSFSVHPERQFYHCFSCKAGGDVFKFVQESEKLGFFEAAEMLSRRAGIAVPERRAGERSQRTPLLEALEAAASHFEQWLADPHLGERTRAYLADRGLEREMVREFRLGLAPPGWENLSQRLGSRFGVEVLTQAGLVARRDTGRGGFYDRFRNRLMIPLIAPGGSVVGFGARALDPADQPKYLNSPESPVYHKGSFLYAFEQARRQISFEDELIVVEGYFDAIALYRAGIRNVVATSGTAFTADQARLLKRAVGRVALTYDGDAAGQGAMMRSLGVLMAEGIEVAVVDLPREHDPDSLVRAGGVAAWQEARAEALDPIEFIQKHGLREGSGESQALTAVVQLAAAVKDPIRQQRLLERGAQVFSLAEPVLARALRLVEGGRGAAPPIEAAVRERSRATNHLERGLLQALLMAPEGLDQAKAWVAPADFHDADAAALAEWIWSEDEAPPGEPAAGLLRELGAGAAEGMNWLAEIEGRARRMFQKKLERQSHGVQQRLEQLGRQGRDADPETLELLRQRHELRRTIDELNR